jgi:AbrB family looped-hinge helix DNA binding protein
MSCGLHNGIKNGISSPMNATVTIDSAGRLVLPKALRERLHLRTGDKLSADVVADKIELTPLADENVKLVRKGKRLVIAGTEPFSAVEAIKAAREEYEERLARPFRRK